MENLLIVVLGGIILMTIIRVLVPKRVPQQIIVITTERRSRSGMGCLPILIGGLILLVILGVIRI